MKIVQTQKFVRVSPRKLRLVADVARKMKADEAIEKLPFTGKKSAQPLVKVISTAIANAKNQNIDTASLVIREIQINEGPKLKRGRPVSRGRWHPYAKRMSNIRVVLEAKDKEGVKKSKKATEEVEKMKVESRAELDKSLSKGKTGQEEKSVKTKTNQGGFTRKKLGLRSLIGGKGGLGRRVQKKG